jgi:Antirepressor regulating drug resistance, predicted signal transduction N-terminal membrane component
MIGLFAAIFNMSLTASYAALVVLFVRLLLKKVPKIFSYSLWAVVLFRLICPFSFKSVLSLIPSRVNDVINNVAAPPNFAPSNIAGITGGAADPAVQSSVPAVGSVSGVNMHELVLQASAYIWLLGIVALLCYGAFSYFKLKRSLSTSTLVDTNIFETDRIQTPFVLGFIKPRIYIPACLSKDELAYILRHEQTHIRRRDYIIKHVAFLALALHWFNPLMWVCYFLMVKDMEMSCDESVMKQSGEDIRKSYSYSLLSLSVKQSGLISPTTFGEGNVKSRVKNVLNYKKPAFWGVAVTVIVVAAVAAGLIFSPKQPAENRTVRSGGSSAASSRSNPSVNPNLETSSAAQVISTGTTDKTAGTGSIVYKNAQYGFVFTLPQSWKGYKIITENWEGREIQSDKTVTSGPEILIRNPLWTSKNPRQDIPIMVFTTAQWNALQQFEFATSAAPIGSSELGRDSKYVFALPPRYNFAFLPGYQEVQTIVAGNPLKPIVSPAAVAYENTHYGILFYLPQSWKGYKIVTEKWEGSDSQTGKTVASGPEILIRNPLWTSKNPRQDIPIMIFTAAQWNSLQKGAFHIGAAPIGPSELNHNSSYVFALPARYNYAYLPGYQEVETILAGKPLQLLAWN